MWFSINKIRINLNTDVCFFLKTNLDVCFFVFLFLFSYYDVRGWLPKDNWGNGGEMGGEKCGESFFFNVIVL